MNESLRAEMIDLGEQTGEGVTQYQCSVCSNSYKQIGPVLCLVEDRELVSYICPKCQALGKEAVADVFRTQAVQLQRLAEALLSMPAKWPTVEIAEKIKPSNIIAFPVCNGVVHDTEPDDIPV